MKKITSSYVKKHVKSAVAQLSPNKIESILEERVEKASGNEWYLDGTYKRHQHMGSKRLKIFAYAAACLTACLAVCFLSFWLLNVRTDATVYLDVNPSIELQVNRSEKVISAKASNPDGKIVLDDMNLKNTELNVAVNAILGSMVKHGYLSEAQNTILLSVDGRSQETEDRLRVQLCDSMKACLDPLLGPVSIFDQGVHVDDTLEALATEYGITPGKAALLQKLTASNPELDYA